MMKSVTVLGVAGGVVAWWCAGAAGQQLCLEWRPDHLGGRSGHAMVYDAARARLVLYGTEDRDTWARAGARSGTEWVRIGTEGPVHPFGLGFAAMCYDPGRGRTVMNIGSGSAGLNETWEFDGAAWVHRASGPLDTFTDFAMAFDAARGEAVLFGGHGYSGVAGSTTWAWNSSAGAWVQRSTIAPRALSGHGMAFDAARGRVVLFGGGDGSSMNGDTWEWDGAAWAVRATTGPVARRGHSMSYDPTRARTVLFGGFSSTSQMAPPETWEWDGAAWSLRSSTGLAARGRAAMVYDPSRGRTVLFGGSNYPTANSAIPDMAETAEWDGMAWSVSAPVGPGVRSGAPMRHDAARGKTILFGGYLPAGAGLSGDTWSWDGQWTRLAAPGPAARYSAAMAYDSVRQRLVLFGGVGTYPAIYGDTWEWDGGAWSQRTPAGSAPAARGYSVAAFDASRGVTVVYGGYSQGYLRETWEWDGQAWMRRADGPGFTERSGLAYDPVRQVCVLVTTVQAPAYHYETWEWDGHGAGSWTARQTSNMPDVGYFAMDYDPRVGAVVLGAGAAVGSFPGAVAPSWRWTGSAWIELEAGEHGAGTAGTFDAARNAMVILSGTDAQMWTLAPCTPPVCYANCDGSGAAPILNIADFGCFLQKYAAADPYANCDASVTPPVLNVADFTCFLQKFGAGCP
jgi:hypothetical protein